MTAPSTQSSPRASALFLREDEIRRGIELLYFGKANLTRAIDQTLAKQGLGRAHHRALYFISRRPDLSVSDLLQILAITKQSLGRVLNELIERGLVEARTGTSDRRQKRLRLTPEGAAMEADLFRALREKLSTAYAAAGQEAVTGFWRVLEGLISPEDQALFASLRRG